MKKVYWSLIACLMTGTAFGQNLAKGTVYIDQNGNGRHDKKEAGLMGVGISNGRAVVQTDKNGKYEIGVGTDDIIFVIKPAGYELPLDQSNQPKFYYIHKPEGSPKLTYPGVEPTGELPKAVDFALVPKEESNHFSAFIFGDPQAYNEQEMEFFKNGVVNEAKNRKGPILGISLGDLVGNDLSLHPSYKSVITAMGLPWYHVIGNHDLNFDVKEDIFSDEGFERSFGPANYSFNVGQAHFIVLDDIIYPHPKTGKGYQGGLRADQIEFIANDLKVVPKNKLIVLAFHIPLNPTNSESFENKDRDQLFAILSEFPNTLSLSAHTHFQQQNFYTKEHGWNGNKPHHEYNVGTASGDWYSGAENESGIPNATMRDGTPKGYAILNIDSNQYTFDYQVIGKPADYGIGIFGPTVVKEANVKRYPIYANFFLGAVGDSVSYKIGNKNWKPMEKVLAADPAYLQHVLEYDGAESLISSRRPSDPTDSDHLWKFKLPKLKAGKHTIEIQAIDMFGRTHTATKEIQVMP